MTKLEIKFGARHSNRQTTEFSRLEFSRRLVLVFWRPLEAVEGRRGCIFLQRVLISFQSNVT